MEAIAAAESAVEAARKQVRLECCGQEEAKFDELAAPMEQKHAAPWLRKHAENGQEVIRVGTLYGEWPLRRVIEAAVHKMRQIEGFAKIFARPRVVGWDEEGAQS